MSSRKRSVPGGSPKRAPRDTKRTRLVSPLGAASSDDVKAARIFGPETQAIVYNYKPNAIQRMLDFDTVCGRKTPSIGALVSGGHGGEYHKAFFGAKEKLFEVYGTLGEATLAKPNADVLINFASARRAYETSMAALAEKSIRTVVIIAEGIPEQMTQKLVAAAEAKNKIIIGPATVGGIQAGAFKIANTAGTIENIISSKLFRPGHVGFVSKSGGMSNEMYRVIADSTDGIYEGIAVGGDAFPGSTLLSHVMRFELIDEIKMIVVLGEVGGVDEYDIVEALKAGKISKPICVWVTGTCGSIFPTEVQFGHAGAKSGGTKETAQAKNAALREAGAGVPDSYEGFKGVIRQTYEKLVEEGTLVPAPLVEPIKIAAEYADMKKRRQVRRATNIISSICNDTGGEPTYARIPMSDVIEKGYSIGDVISLLWFRRRLPREGSQMLELCLKLTADHGPCVSGAHNAIVASRAGKDLVSCVASGILTVGPRFGGAIDDAAKYFKEAADNNEEPKKFVERLTKMNIRVPGIGHRVKSATNPDKRVVLLQSFVKSNFRTHKYLDYAEAVEAYTLLKNNKLILNVDGCIGVCFVDCLVSSGLFTDEEVTDFIRLGYLNGIFLLGRTMGIIGHALDQKRMKQPLYRHPTDDVLYYEDWE